jgi:N6-adenosine-specific RNA methylase IME4
MVEIADIHSRMGLVLPMLRALMAQGTQDWDVSDVINHCIDGSWTLLVDEDERAFMMVSLGVTEYSKTRQLRIEIACHANSTMKAPDFYPLLDTLAREMRCKQIVMESERSGWERIGWRKETIIYSRNVTEAINASTI